VSLTPAKEMSLEEAITWINSDEIVEMTPSCIRVRKMYLDENERKRQGRKVVSDEQSATLVWFDDIPPRLSRRRDFFVPSDCDADHASDGNWQNTAQFPWLWCPGIAISMFSHGVSARKTRRFLSHTVQEFLMKKTLAILSLAAASSFAVVKPYFGASLGYTLGQPSSNIGEEDGQRCCGRPA
jgi:hypothetical protein